MVGMFFFLRPLSVTVDCRNHHIDWLDTAETQPQGSHLDDDNDDNALLLDDDDDDDDNAKRRAPL